MSSIIKSNTIEILTSKKFNSEKRYVFSVFVEDYLGCNLKLNFCEGYLGHQINYNSRSIKLPDVFFEKGHYENKSILEVKNISFHGDSIPAWFYSDSNKWDCNADVFGMAFFLMSGYADIHFSEKDKFERNIGNSSFLVKNNLIDRPILQEWFLLVAKYLFNEDELKNLKLLKSKKHVSHDVDQPFEYLNYSLARLFKRILGDIIFRKNFQLVKTRISNYIRIRDRNYENDPYNNFNELIEMLDKYNITSTFFFVASDNKHPNDVDYAIEQEAIKQIMRKVHKAGHKVGLHPSFYTYKNTSKLKEEVDRLKSTLLEIGINQEVAHCRKHYLRWDWESTPAEMYNSGFTDDYTVGYADRSGFRVGVAFPYAAFDWRKKKALALKLHPLIVMECSLTSAGYMGLDYLDSKKVIESYHTIIQEKGGEFVLLWHNHLLIKNEDRKLFEYFLGL